MKERLKQLNAKRNTTKNNFVYAPEPMKLLLEEMAKVQRMKLYYPCIPFRFYNLFLYLLAEGLYTHRKSKLPISNFIDACCTRVATKREVV